MSRPMFQFGAFTLDTATSTLSRNGVRVPLEPQPTLLLEQLVRRAGQIVGRTELADTVWGATGTHVSVDDGLNYGIRCIRAALEDDPRHPRFLATVPRRGYRFVAPVTTVVLASAEPQTLGSMRGARWVALALAAAMLLVVIEIGPNNHHEVTMRVLRAVHRAIF